VPTLAIVLAYAGCTPPTAPLYHDFEHSHQRQRDGQSTSYLLAPLAEALEAAGWTVRSSDVQGVIATEPRTVRQWGLYRIDVSLEAALVGESHVRVFIHPFRRFVTGGQSKLFALDGRLRRTLLPPLDHAFRDRGFTPLAPLRQRDERAVRPN
jgi:hypothetical protein